MFSCLNIAFAVSGFETGKYLWMSTFRKFKMILMTVKYEAITVKRTFVLDTIILLSHQPLVHSNVVLLSMYSTYWIQRHDLDKL